ncbi:MAG: hypothetical protein NE334_10690 [Lentisphaeraceae bacterium]|nr:hypothetical protein [Lentisphaeraceae bacterium]
MKKSLCLLSMFMFLNFTHAQLNIDTSGRGGTKSVTRKTNKPKEMKLIEKNVLFVGNQHSQANSLNQVFQYQGAQLPTPYNILAATIIGKDFSFKEHLALTQIDQVYEKYSWDIAIIQGNADKATAYTDEYRANAAKLIQKFREKKTQVILFMPWAANYSKETNTEIFKIHHAIALENKVKLAPVGSAFITAKKNESKINLYREDLISPSPQGSYLAAAVLIQTMTRLHTIGQKQLGLKSISRGEATYLQKVAAKIYKDYQSYLKRNVK